MVKKFRFGNRIFKILIFLACAFLVVSFYVGFCGPNEALGTACYFYENGEIVDLDCQIPDFEFVQIRVGQKQHIELTGRIDFLQLSIREKQYILEIPLESYRYAGHGQHSYSIGPVEINGVLTEDISPLLFPRARLRVSWGEDGNSRDSICKKNEILSMAIIFYKKPGPFEKNLMLWKAIFHLIF